MKKLLALLMAIALVFSLAACGSTESVKIININLTEEQLLDHLQVKDSAEGEYILNHNGKQYKLCPFFLLDKETYSVYIKLTSRQDPLPQ